ncbi:DNA sulfur modification protein DndC [Litorivivens lipolytica]|uniref:DNA sulfur modification protein DndC n=1 Tax=Litorivivens lipolytica TaxID=1524264 RepID=A0A7W4W4Q1_9GAMM|nr:DNA phosphorothioation system sulfurtransferase DndC [Litorivivens lipolytica]MBB3047426.1 DNA sulfur modification protein DndC [Litorivivens lipolytica]
MSPTEANGLLYASHEQLIDELIISGQPISALVEQIQEIYLSDDRPWIIGFSGGKDSTTVLSLIYSALQRLPSKSRRKHIYVVSSDTLVETPVVVDMINHTIQLINTQSKKEKLPISAHAVYPDPDQTFWVNLLGRGYPAPKQQFRWCTERMKIDPVSSFIKSKVQEFGEVIVALGSRSQESASRAQVIARHSIADSALSRHTSLPNAYTYMPIVSWSADDVWEYLMSGPCPWGGTNRQLLELYKGSNQGECPLVIDKSTPSCGNSRFGCWTCTVVTEDKALHSLIENGEEWMAPLLKFRNDLYESTRPENKNEYRNYKRRTGRVTYVSADRIDDSGDSESKHIPGPYWLEVRRKWVSQLLAIEKDLRSQGHNIELIREEELQAIRQHWLRDPNEPDWKDTLPAIVAEIYPDSKIEWIDNDAGMFTEHDTELMASVASKHDISPEMIMKLLEVELSVSGLGRRKGVHQRLLSVLKQDWGSLEEIKEKHQKTKPDGYWKSEIQKLTASLNLGSN